jgi:hypothetical protein
LCYLSEDDDDHEALPLTNVVLIDYVVAGRLGEGTRRGMKMAKRKMEGCGREE